MDEEKSGTEAGAVTTSPATPSEDLELEVTLTKHKIPLARVAELRTKFPKLYVLIDVPIIIKPATGAQLDVLGRKSEKDRVGAAKDLAGFLVVHPSPAEYLALLAEYPLIWSTVIGVATEIAQNKPVTDAKKL